MTDIGHCISDANPAEQHFENAMRGFWNGSYQEAAKALDQLGLAVFDIGVLPIEAPPLLAPVPRGCDGDGGSGYLAAQDSEAADRKDKYVCDVHISFIHFRLGIPSASEMVRDLRRVGALEKT